MRLAEITALNEANYGDHGFPGYGRGLFARSHYWWMVNRLQEVSDPEIKGHLLSWVINAFQRDNPNFKPELFRRVVEQGKTYDDSKATWQQRHYYYLAELTKTLSNPTEREYVAHWLADVVGHRANPKFHRKRWFSYAGVEDSEPEKDEAPRTRKRRQRAPALGHGD